MKAVEMFYSVQEIGLLLRLCDKTVLRRLRDREFGDQVVNLGSEDRPDYRVPASGVNGYLQSRRVFTEGDVDEPGLAARSLAELKRRVTA
nr:hypothetical protein [uncultured Rhodopila sp.]